VSLRDVTALVAGNECSVEPTDLQSALLGVCCVKLHWLRRKTAVHGVGSVGSDELLLAVLRTICGRIADVENPEADEPVPAPSSGVTAPVSRST
jgi:hypothetical protein